MLTSEELVATALSHPVNAALMERLPALGLPQCYVAAGCIFQPLWNVRSGKPVTAGIKDFDIFYFDEDLSWEAENAVIETVAEATRDLDGEIEVRNQARIHLWYEERFGYPYEPLTCARDGIERFLITCTCVGIEVASGALYAPFGLEDLGKGILKFNPLKPHLDLFRAKAASYRERWPWLTIVEPEAT